MKLVIKYSLLALVMSMFVQLQAQTNVDSIFNKAIQFSQKNEYNKAIYEATKAIKADSNRGDMYVFLANVYSWKNSNDTALMHLDTARKLDYLNDDFYESALNVLLRAQKNDSILKVCDEAATKGYKNTKDLALKRMLAYDNKKDYKAIVELSKSDENKAFIDDKLIDALVKNAKVKTRRQMLSLDYSVDFFENSNPSLDPNPYQLLSAAYTLKTKSISSTIGLNYANRLGKDNVQLEYTGYKTLKSNNYWYVNYGYAFGPDLFPKHRVGLEYFFKLSKNWDASFGGRYLYYPTSETDKNIYIVTGSVGAYLKNNWFSVRPYFVIGDTFNSLTVTAKYRVYAANPANFWGVELGFGNSPDDSFTQSQGRFNELMSYRLKLEKNISLSDQHQLFLAAGYVSEEYKIGLQSAKRERLIFEIGYRFIF